MVTSTNELAKDVTIIHGFFIGFLVQKYPKMTCKRKPPYQFGQVILAMSCILGSQIRPCHFDWQRD
jgi:hypothetical protein